MDDGQRKEDDESQEMNDLRPTLLTIPLINSATQSSLFKVESSSTRRLIDSDNYHPTLNSQRSHKLSQ